MEPLEVMDGVDLNEPLNSNKSKNKTMTSGGFLSKLNSKCILCIIFFVGLTNCMYLFLEKINSSHFDVIVSKFINKTILKDDANNQ